MKPEAFGPAVVAWYEQHGRKDLPWQQDVSPYRVWVSEIMLQQTQVTTVMDYFTRFMHAMPSVHDLAAAPLDEVLHLWTGLGYYTRARNLHKTAQLICTEYGGEFPRNAEALATLPGIGPSTAGAIASLSMGIRAPILDGNVKRVLARYSAEAQYPGASLATKRLWALAEQLTPQQDVAKYTQAMMDLGATLCTRKQPECERCPVNSGCLAYATEQQNVLPAPRPRKTLPVRQVIMPLLINQDHTLLLQQRPTEGIWGGLWSLPELDNIQALQPLLNQYQLLEQRQQPLTPVRHTFSHFHLDIEPWLINVHSSPSLAVAENNWLWYNLFNPPRLGLAAPIKGLIERALIQLQQEN
ncbi:A/G-specific adenine glycosylase [Denitrificimonas sp. JX-1]|uniref:Adenine DNA glycosylase n=1 Tax=Denitrificimonas halotolerans TaxID=3098930 RepID=A0ABU5GT89_9GAMM|nr:A/G-specific adenine glycosylase [Denitrificimonas sp. JX-1]MDY7220207.1 A/G-specific adenine glycosylase [Denitrificimonas sp. JX-1]